VKSLLSQKGVTSLKAALILPILFVLTFGLVEFGLFMYNQQVLTNAAREGARVGILQRDPRITEAEIRQVVMRYLRPPDGAGPWRLVTFNTTPTPVFDPPLDVCTSALWDVNDYVNVNVALSSPYLVIDPLVRLLSLNLVQLPPVTLRTESVMKCE
jgi:Flp pilus assembly protein TadG